MQGLPSELLLVITNHINYGDQATLSLTCKSLRKALPQTYSLLDCCVYDGTLKQIQLAELSGNNWTNDTYYQLGAGGNIQVAEYRCVTKMFGFRKFNLIDCHAEQIYNGACQKGLSLMLEWLYSNYKPRSHFDNQWSSRGVENAAYEHHYHLLDELIQHKAKSINSIWKVAGLFFDLELVKYCLVKKIECSYFLDYVVSSKKPLWEVKNFLFSCEAEGLDFHRLELPASAPSLEWTLTFIRYGVKYVGYCGQIIACKKLFSKANLGKVDWTNRREKRYLLAVTMARYKTKDWQEICCLKKFLKEEKNHNSTMSQDVYKEFTDLHLAQKSDLLKCF